MCGSPTLKLLFFTSFPPTLFGLYSCCYSTNLSRFKNTWLKLGDMLWKHNFFLWLRAYVWMFVGTTNSDTQKTQQWHFRTENVTQWAVRMRRFNIHHSTRLFSPFSCYLCIASTSDDAAFAEMGSWTSLALAFCFAVNIKSHHYWHSSLNIRNKWECIIQLTNTCILFIVLYIPITSNWHSLIFYQLEVGNS